MPSLDQIIDAEQVLGFQDLVRRVPVPQHIYEFAVDLVRRTRPNTDEAPEWLKPLVAWGAGPRAVQYLILGGKSRAALTGSYMVRLEDIMAVAEPVLGHRVLTTFGAESEGIKSTDIVKRLVDELNAE
jgi:MoxR-like ATPase